METEEREDVSQKHAVNVKVEAMEEVTSGHTCGVCGRSFPLLSSLSQHMRRHTREKPYNCPYCEHRTAQKGSLKAHIRSHKLGLLDKNPSVKEEDGNENQRDNTETPDPAEIVKTLEKSHKVNGKVKKKETKKKVKGKNSIKTNEAGSFSCTLCGLVFPQVLLLKSHMKRHRNSQDYGCRRCGRRFREAWFLQSHMRIHRDKGQLRGGNNEPPSTINGIPQDPATLINDECLYELCAGCGNFFFDIKSLQIHEKLHKPSHSRSPIQDDHEASEKEIAKRGFMKSLYLTNATVKDISEEKSLGLRIPQLDPICSYQTWQLATKGRLVEVTEKCPGQEERIANAEVPNDTEKGEYVPLKQKKKRKRIDTSSSNVKRKKVDAVLDSRSDSLAHTKVGDKRIHQKDRILFNGLGHAFYEALQNKTPKQTNTVRSLDQEDKKPLFCKHCDFHTDDASLLRSHLHRHHQDILGSQSRHSTILDFISQSGSKSSRYPQHITEVKRPGQTSDDNGSLLNLSALPTHEGDSTIDFSIKTESLVRHQCPYCSHATTYPEVLWIHQRVAHRVDGSSSMAPKWAPCTNSLKSLKVGTSQWRRTGPPPFLEGKDCPALPAPRSHRTQAPDSSTPNHSARTHSQSRTHSRVSKSKHSSKDSHSSDVTYSSARMGLIPQKKSDGQNKAVEGASKSFSPQATSSSSAMHNKSDSSFQPTSSTKHRDPRAAVEGNFPQEGLGFMLARSHGRTSSNTATERLRPRRHSYESSSGLKGPDLWTAMNMWGLHGSKAYFDPLLFAQGKSESAGEMPMDTDILSLLKSYSPHDLAALYQHWGFIDPRIDPQAMLQVNGYFGNEVHSSSEAPIQANSNSTSSSGSCHKET